MPTPSQRVDASEPTAAIQPAAALHDKSPEPLLQSVPQSEDSPEQIIPSTEVPDVIPLLPPPAPPGSKRYPERSNRTTWKDRVFHIQANRALKIYGRAALKSMADEIRSVAIEKGAINPVHVGRLSVGEMKSIIISSMFLKEKFSPTGEFEKLKARLVAGGHLQDRSLVDKNDISSPTVATTSVFITAAIAAQENRHAISFDIGTAYLNASMTGKKIYMRLNRRDAGILCMMVPEYREFLEESGTMVVQITKALYGCIESARLWFDHISKTLKDDGFVPNPKDPCVFNKTVRGSQVTVCLHVDDGLITSCDEAATDETIDLLVRSYKDVKFSKGLVHNYLGMVLDFSKLGTCRVSMPNFVSEILLGADIEGTVATPAAENLFVIRDAAKPLSDSERERFHTLTAKLQFLAKRVRPDILTAVIFLSTRVTKPDEDDMRKLERVIRYLRGTRDLCLTLIARQNLLELVAFIDASFAVHGDYKSHSGVSIFLGLGGIFFKSVKQKLNSKSSTEAELIAVSDGLTMIIWIREFLIGQGYNVGPATLFQDNKSTIQLIANGRSNSERTRHVNIRFFFVKDRVSSGEIKIEYVPTDNMIADMLTKPLQGALFRSLRSKLLNSVE